jgi:hypothetical protein
MTLAEIIAKHIPAATLEGVVFDQGVLTEEQRTAIFKSTGLTAHEIATRVLAVYDDRAYMLADGLSQQVSERDWDTAELLFPFFRERGAYYNNQQASLIGRIPTLSLEELSRFLEAVKRHVCVIVYRHASGHVERGTGFLVAKDLVLTCRHVLKDIDKNASIGANGRRVEVFFDFHRGGQVEDVDPLPPGARRVTLAAGWHVDSCEDTVPDGLLGVLSQVDDARIRKSLDFVLLRLAEPVGLQPVNRGGGRRRGWIELPPRNFAGSLEAKDWIIIPQHPNGLPLRIDLGRYHGGDQTETRIRYNTNTAPGTSGAPCFNEKFHLVGVHNAAVPPVGKAIANQAIRWDLVEARVKPHVLAAISNYTLRWSTSRDGENVQVILGREKLLEWIKASAVANPRHRADRVYAAHATVAYAGCSFSSDVLHAEIRDSKIRRAVYGQRGQQLPQSAEDFLRSLLRELAIDPQKVAPADAMPLRPGGAETSGVAPLLGGEVDKLDKWLADELPTWLGRIINAHLDQQVDAREAARKLLDYYHVTGQEVDPEVLAEIKKNSEAPNPVMVRAVSWQCAYVVIDDLRASEYNGAGARTELRGEVEKLIAALVRGKSEDALHSGLRRLRWMFLGYLPDFLTSDPGDGTGAVLEHLDPNAIGEREVFAVFTRMFDANVIRESWYNDSAVGYAKASVKFAQRDDDTEPWLLRLQRRTGQASEDALQEPA